jgi:hypothetical protein
MSEFEKSILRIRYTSLIAYFIIAAGFIGTGFHMINVANKMYYDMKETMLNHEYRINTLETCKNK